MSDLVQLSIRIPKSQRGCIVVTRANMRLIVQRWLDTGRTPLGIKISGTIWGRPSQRRHIRAAFKGKARSHVCLGKVAHYDQPNMTLCDYDTSRPPSLERVWKVSHWCGVEPLAVEYQASRRGWHVAITWERELPAGVRLAMQMALGSDMGRELFNLKRLIADGGKTRSWNLLFETKLP